MPSHRPPTARRALLCALVVLAASQPAAQARTPPRPFIELGLGAGGGPDNFGWRAHIAIGELSSHPLGRRWEVAVGRFGAGRGCPTDAGFNCGRGFAWVVSGSVLGGYRPTRSARGPFLLFGPGLSYSNGSAYRASGVQPTLQAGVGVASKAVGGPIFLVQGRFVAHGIWRDNVTEFTLGLGVRF